MSTRNGRTRGKSSLWLGLASLFLILSCSQKSETSAEKELLGVLNPKPAEPASQDSRASRYLDQKSFLNFAGNTGGWEGGVLARSATKEMAEGAPGAPDRQIQESDVFKIGKAGSKLLYLLNNSRGVQAVSFEKGAEKPELLGRVSPTGNYTDDMYYDAARDQILVLENNWSAERQSADVGGRILIYDMSNPKTPQLKETVSVAGEIADSRIVGDVLYVATSQWGRPTYNIWGRSVSNGTTQATGNVFSFALERGNAKQIGHVTLNQPVSRRENMNTVKVGEKYYLVAILSDERGWGWWDRKNMVEVIDITDAGGKIKPVMLAAARGNVNERSQTVIKNDTLIVASNYQPEETNAVNRIAVEVFKFPGEEPKILSERQANLRKIYAEEELSKETDPKKRDELKEKLAADPTWGVRGAFVQSKGDNDGDVRLTKLMPDFQQNVGSSQIDPATGRAFHAFLEDTRVSGDMLYTFWRPASNRDPLDVFDISAPQEKLAHLGHLEFEGWLERSIPMEHKGHQYVLGLGHIVETLNNERQVSYPQAMLIEIKKVQPSGKVRFEIISQIKLDKGNVWVNFNAPDKFIEVQFKGDGTGAAMFQIESWGQGGTGSGAKILGFDLNKAVEGRDDVFTEGRVIVGRAEWLRRVFTNPEIMAVNTFSNTALGTYKVDDTPGAAGEVANAISILELARNIQGYVQLNGLGIQIVNNYGYWNSADSKIQLRVVSAKKADAELPEVSSTLELTGGNYRDHLVTADGKLLVAMERSEWQNVAAGKYKQTEYFVVHRLAVAGQELKLEGSTKWEVVTTEKTRQESLGVGLERAQFGYYGGAQALIQTKSGAVVMNASREMRLLTGDKAEALDAKTCLDPEKLGVKKERLTRVALQVISDDLFLTYSVSEEDLAKREGVAFVANYLAPARIDGAKLACSSGINIPGRAVAVLRGGKQIITEDQHLRTLVQEKYTTKENEKEVVHTTYRGVTEPWLVALEQKKDGDKEAYVLKDFRDTKGLPMNHIKQISPTEFAYFESNEQPNEFGPMFGGMMMEEASFRGRPWGRRTPKTTTQLIRLSLDQSSTRFTEVSTALDIKVKNPTLVAVFKDPRAARTQGHLGVVVGGNQLQVVSWTGARTPQTRLLSKLDPRFEKEKASEVVNVLDPWMFVYGYNRDALHFSADARSLEIAQGLSGVTQIYVEE